MGHFNLIQKIIVHFFNEKVSICTRFSTAENSCKKLLDQGSQSRDRVQSDKYRNTVIQVRNEVIPLRNTEIEIKKILARN